MKRQKLDHRLAFLIHVKNDRDTFHVFAEIVRVLPDGKVRNPGSYEGESREYQNFRVYSQGNSFDFDNRPVPTEKRNLYAWECEYSEVHHIGAGDAQRMAKTLNRIERKMSKTAQKYGYPATFGAYLLRVAEATGVDAFMFYPEGNKRSSYDDNDFINLDLPSGASRVDHEIDKWKHENEVDTEKASA